MIQKYNNIKIKLKKIKKQISDTVQWTNSVETEVDVRLSMIITLDTSQSPITPYGSPVVVSFEAAKIGQDPSAVSLKQLVTAAFKAVWSAGVNTVSWYWLQVFIEDVQNRLLEDVQSLVPQAQLSELAAVPSLTEHVAYWLQVLIKDVQNKPLEAAVQSLVPQAQLSELAELPSTTEHGAYWLQVFVDDVQNNPL